MCQTYFVFGEGLPLNKETEIGTGGGEVMILSLQGCMAVGKTTAVKYLQKNAPYVTIGQDCF